MSDSDSEAINIDLKAKDLTKAAFSSVGSAIKLLSGNIGSLTSVAKGMIDTLGKFGLAASGVESLAQSFSGLANALLGGNARLEMTTISLTTLLGSASAANDMIQQLTKFAANTPFELAGLESSTQRLLAFGFNAKDIIPIMTSLGDAISALGGTQDNLNSLVYVMGQMRQEAHINAGDIMQMVNLGIPALQMLADHYKVTTSQIQDMISKGLIPGTDAVKIFTESLEQRYGGMMAAQSATFSGMVSNLQDWASATSIILTKPFFEPAKKALGAFLTYVQSPVGIAAINKLAEYIQLGVDKMTSAFTRLLPQAKKLWVTIEPAVKAFLRFKQAISPVGIALNTLKGFLNGGVNGAIEAFKDRFALIEIYVKKGLALAMVEVRKFGPGLLDWISQTAVEVAKKAVVWGEALINWVVPYASRLITELLKLAAQVINWIVSYAPVIANQLFTWGTALVEWVAPAIPRLLAALVDLGLRVFNWIIGKVPALLGALTYWGNTFAAWIAPSIPIMVGALGQISEALLKFVIGLGPQLVTALLQSGRALGVELGRPVSEILLVFKALASNIKGTVVPAFNQMTGFLSRNLFPILDRLAIFTAKTIIPTAAALAAFLMRVGVPAFVRLADVIGRVFGPSLTLIGSLIRNQLLPTLTHLWNTFEVKYLPTVQRLASAFGDRLAGSIELAISKFKNALPALEDLYKKLEPIVNKALELYQAISPLAIIFDTLTGLVTGGLQGGFQALEKHVLAIGQAFGVNLQPALDWFNDTILNKVIPTVLQWGSTFITDWWPKIRDAVGWVIGKIGDFADFISTKVWPPFKSFLDWVADQGTKLWNSISDTLQTTVIPAIKDFIHWIADVMWPKLRDEIFPWIDKNVRPKLEDAFKIIDEKIIPFLGNMVDTILNHIIPALVAWWGVLFTLINPFLKTIGDMITNNVLPAMDSLFGTAKDNKKGINDLVDGFKAFLGIVGQIVDGFHRVWEAMGGWLVESVISNVGKIVQMLGLMADSIGALLKGDYVRAVQDMAKAAVILGAPGSQKISGSGTNTDNAAQVRLQEYMMNHPDYDPSKAGNAPKKARGDSSFLGGPVWWGEAGMERLKIPGGPTLYASGPVFSPDMTGGSKFTPGRDLARAGNGNPVNIYLTVHGQPDMAQLAKMKQVAKDAVKQGLSELANNAQNQRAVNRTRG